MTFLRALVWSLGDLTCSAEDIHVGNKGITGNMYSNGYSIDTKAITLIVRAL